MKLRTLGTSLVLTLAAIMVAAAGYAAGQGFAMPEPAKPGSISGKVINRDGKPVEGAWVRTYTQSTRTNAAGEFVIKDVIPSIYTVSAWNWDQPGPGRTYPPVQAPGPDDGKRLVGVVPAVLEVKSGEELKIAEPITLEPTITVKGRAVGEDGKPVAKFIVEARMPLKWIREGGFVGVQTTTDEKGEFSLAGVPMGATVEIFVNERLLSGKKPIPTLTREQEFKEVTVGDIVVKPLEGNMRGRLGG